ncbi:hypothetical protein Bbelb_064900 [Branchiostoma belcheri]|nr:hypothetical protein Bbelb_064900 [Branchiostoma belcheri]
MYEQAEPVRTLQPGSDREQNNRPRAPYPDTPGRLGNTSGHVGCDVKVYEQAEPVRTSQAGFDGEQNNRPRAPYPDPPARRGNTGGHGKHAPHAYYKGKETSSNVYEEAEVVKLENISGNVPHVTETSTDTDTAQPDGARVKGRRVRHIAAGLAVITTLVTVGVILLVFLNHGTYNHKKDILNIPTTVSATDLGHKQNQTAVMKERTNEKTNIPVVGSLNLGHKQNQNVVMGQRTNEKTNIPEWSALLAVRLWGLSGDSSICFAAIHDGRIPATGGEVTVYKLPGQSSYQASNQHGVISQATSYDNARKLCIDDGGTLAMPKTRELDVALRNLVKTVGLNQDYWIGMKDVETLDGQKARWQWEDGSDLGNYQPPLTSKIRLARLRLFGHIARAVPLLETTALLREPAPITWSRPRGRPRRTWCDQLKDDLLTVSLNLDTAKVSQWEMRPAPSAHVQRMDVLGIATRLLLPLITIP